MIVVLPQPDLPTNERMGATFDLRKKNASLERRPAFRQTIPVRPACAITRPQSLLSQLRRQARFHVCPQPPASTSGSPGFARSPALSPSRKALGGWAWRIFVQFSSAVLGICVFVRRAITSGSANQLRHHTCGMILSMHTNWVWAPLALRHTRGRISSPAGSIWHMSCTEP